MTCTEMNMLYAKINSIMSSSYCETMDLVKISST